MTEQRCQTCGRPLPQGDDGAAERQACGRQALPVPHVGLCFATDDRGSFIIRWSARPVQTSRHDPFNGGVV